MNDRTFPFIFLILLAASAGCAGKPQAVSQDAGAATDASTVTTILEGWVMDEESIPLVEAEILIQGLELGRLTNSEGGYRFVDLPPGEYLLSVAKTGYVNGTQFAQVRQGFATVLNFTLLPELGIEPYTQTQLFEGHIVCHAFVGDDPETGNFQDCGASSPTNLPSTTFEVHSNAVQVLVEVEWVPASAAAEQLLLTVQTTDRGAQNLRFAHYSGPTGIRAVINEDNLNFYFPSGGPLEVRMGPGPSINNPSGRAGIGVALEQDFTVHLTQFFVQAGADGFTAIGQG